MRLSRALFAAALAAALVPAAAHAARGLDTGFNDNYYMSPDAGLRGSVFDATVEAQAEIVRINVVWRTLVNGQPADPRNPADPAYSFGVIDRAVGEATARGLDVLLTVYGAPAFAEGAGRPADAPSGTWKPDPAAYGAFAEAVARRYSGSFGGLPKVRYFQAWNEPNLTNYLTPQYEGGFAAAPQHYRALLNAFYDAAKGVDPQSVVVTAGTAPYGDPPGVGRTRPLAFWRDVLCLEHSKELRPTACATKAKFDVLAHHPINTSGGPEVSAVHPDDAATPDFGEVRRILRAAETHGTVGVGGRHELWATEIWWDSRPPDDVEGIALKTHARWLEEALYVLWKQGASAVINLQMRDVPFNPGDADADTSTGLLFSDGTEKPAFTAFRFPFVADRLKRGKLLVWGKAPAGGKLAIQQRRGGRWVNVRSTRVKADEVFTKRLKLSGSPALRGRVGSEKSLVWRVR